LGSLKRGFELMKRDFFIIGINGVIPDRIIVGGWAY